MRKQQTTMTIVTRRTPLVDRATPIAARLAAVVSLASWSGVTVAGRLSAYT
jgi:hypothetical protein